MRLSLTQLPYSVSGIVAESGEENYSPNFWLPENCQKIFWSKNRRPKMQNMGPKTSNYEAIKGDIKISSTHNLICWKFAASVDVAELRCNQM